MYTKVLSAARIWADQGKLWPSCLAMTMWSEKKIQTETIPVQEIAMLWDMYKQNSEASLDNA